MAGSVNKVILIGNVGKDPEIKTGGDGGKEFATFSVATSESWRDKETGERQERTEWHRIVVFNDRLVPVVKQYVRKGSRVYIEGAQKTRKWTDRDGVERYVTETVLGPFRVELQVLTKTGEGGVPAAQSPEDYGTVRNGDKPYQRPTSMAEDFKSGFGRDGTANRPGLPADDFDDEIPF